MTRQQLFMAMAACDLTDAELSEATDVRAETLSRIRKRHSTGARTLAKLERFFTERGIEFRSAGGRVCVCAPEAHHGR